MKIERPPSLSANIIPPFMPSGMSISPELSLISRIRSMSTPSNDAMRAYTAASVPVDSEAQASDAAGRASSPLRFSGRRFPRAELGGRAEGSRGAARGPEGLAPLLEHPAVPFGILDPVEPPFGLAVL